MDTNTPRYSKTSFWQKITLAMFGVFLTLILIETELRLGEFIILSLQERRNRASLMQRGEYRILCLGESTTQGQYPPFLEEALNRRNIGIKFSVIDKGIPGINTWTILSKLESYLDTYHPDMVITMMGINDWVPHIPYESVSDSKIINCLKSFRTYKLTRLLWLHIVNRLKESQLRLLLRKIGLQQVYVEEKGVSPSKELLKFKKAIELNPRKDMAYLELGSFYLEQGRFSEVEELLKNAIEINPRNNGAYVLLGRCYQKQGRFSEAEELFKKAIEINPRNDGACGALEVLFIEMGDMGLAKKYAKEVGYLRLNYHTPITTSNYHKLVRILDKRSMAYVCIQYPMRSIEPLKKIFENNNDGIIFVDNEKCFKEAVSKSSYKEYFNDMFGGDFGHCTEKGNRLLAENIANVILKEVFGK